MKVVVSGSRDYPELDAVSWWLDELLDRYRKSLEIVVGDARGVDEEVRAWATRRYIPLTVYTPDWHTFGKAAGPIRNRAMVESDPRPDLVVAFWDGKSRGTWSTIQAAMDLMVNLEVRFP